MRARGPALAHAACAFFLVFAGCGGQQMELLDTTGPQPRMVLQGACSPSTASTQLLVELRESTCALPLASPTLAGDEATFRTLFVTGCEVPAVDFNSRRALVLASSSAQGFLFPHFVHARADALEVGLLERRLGSIPPTAVLLLPRTPESLELRSCREVCVENCVTLP